MISISLIIFHSFISLTSLGVADLKFGCKCRTPFSKEGMNVIGSVNSKIYIYISVYLSSFIGLYVPFMSYIMAKNSRYFTGNCIWHYRKLVGITYLGSVVSLGQYR